MSHIIFKSHQKGGIYTPLCEYFYVNRSFNIYNCQTQEHGVMVDTTEHANILF